MNGATKQSKLISLFLCVVMAFGFILTYTSTKPVWRTQKAPGLLEAEIDVVPDLRALLRGAAREDNTVIVTEMMWGQLNSTITSLDLFLESFQIGEQISDLLRHVVILAADTSSFQHCKSKHPRGSCLLLPSDVDVEVEGQSFLAMAPTSRDLQLRWRRLEFLQTVLHLGYNLIFTDLDVMWFRRPFLHFRSGAHLIIAATYDFSGAGDSDDVIAGDGGFMYAKSCDQSIAFYDYWRSLWRKYPGLSEQSALSRTLDDTRGPLLLEVQFLDPTYFAGFCQLASRRRRRHRAGLDVRKICVVHANCCGDDSSSSDKDHDLGVLLQDWKNYTRGYHVNIIKNRQNAREEEDFAWGVPNKCNIINFHSKLIN